jgi:hypothetical protein
MATASDQQVRHLRHPVKNPCHFSAIPMFCHTPPDKRFGYIPRAESSCGSLPIMPHIPTAASAKLSQYLRDTL